MSELCRIGDQIERSGLMDWYGAGRAELTAVREVEPGVVALRASVASAVYSRVLGVGVERPATPALIDASLAVLRELHAERAFFHVADYTAPPELALWLEQRGVQRYPRSWMRFVAEPSQVAKARTDLSIRPAVVSDAADVDAVLRTAFDVPSDMAGFFSPLLGRQGWHIWVVTHEQAVVGAGVMFVEGEVGWLAAGGVAASARGRGAQSALIAARLEAAFDLGCRWVFSETGEAVPNDPQHSYRNLLRGGFRELRLRHNYRFMRAG
jgi:GNAT superfamily N-acetyltransferase